jgi:hypothetical protein
VKGAQATQDVVDNFSLRLQALVNEAKEAHVVLQIELLPTPPLKMGGHMMVPQARAEWHNTDD